MFFESDRTNFFRPLAGTHREAFLDCILSVYSAVLGPTADLTRPFTRDDLKDVLYPVVQRHHATAGTTAELSEGVSSVSVSEVIRTLLQDGWLERAGDAAGIVTVYRFTRAGKLVAEALWAVDRAREQVRQRNVRGCRNALESALKTGDALDLIDAHDYAERVLGDLAEGVDYFQGLMRNLVRRASNTPWDEFVEFLERFEREFKQQLTADNVERHRLAIRDALSALHTRDAQALAAMDARLHEVAPLGWRVSRTDSGHLLGWVLTRIDELVESACESKYPELLKTMGAYMRRTAAIAQQAYLLRAQGAQSGLHQAIRQVAKLDSARQDALLRAIGARLTSVEVRLVDPAAVRLRAQRAKARAAPTISAPVLADDARVLALMQQAEATAFSVSNDTVRERLDALSRKRKTGLTLDQLPAGSVDELLTLLHAVEAARSDEEGAFTVTQLEGRYETPYFSGTNYRILKK